MNSYPTARNYRGTKPGTIREPGPSRRPPGPSPRRTPGRPAARPRPTYRPGPIRPPAALPKPPAGISSGAMRAGAAALRGFGPLAAAFSLGFAIGSILFRPKMTGNIIISNPLNWDEYICPTPIGGPPFMSGVTYAMTEGVSADNCIAGQNAGPGPGTNLRRGFWYKYGPAGNNNAHIASFLNSAAVSTPLNMRPTARPEYVAGPAIAPDPWFRENVGPLIRTDPRLNPISSPVGPEVGPRPSTAPKPVPGVGPEGYHSGEPGSSNQPGQNANPSPRPSTRPNPNPSRPPRGVKEKKMRASRIYGLAAGAFGNLTEVEDLLDAFHDSLEKGCGKGVTHKNQSAKAKPVWEAGGDTYRWKRIWTGKYSKWVRDKGQYRAPTFLEKWDAVYANWDCVNLGDFWKNYIDNQAEDSLFGTASKDDAEASKRLRPGIRIGIGTGPAL